MTPLPIPLQWTTGLLGLGIACAILLLIRKDSLHVRHSIWWLTVAAGSVLLGFFPRLVDQLGTLLGVHYPPILFLTMAVGMILIKILTMDIERSRQERALRRLTQRMAILEARLPDQHQADDES
ncbi:DUF2304 domain-containing protein [Desulfonatronum lacustre]|uniref:DUF2304 domain-containing protein n=1 Tax=Desulfonatronum lacustre TaxID=66849 RepID=UPI0004AE3114|nr:DUF2304 domain-containing protein [Desulfonatronum lacustre]